ncbi:Hypothetical predicted protein, partial [Paramuricea clavata]
LSNPSSNLNTGAIIGALVAALIVLITVVLIVACFLYRRIARKENTQDIGNIQNAAYEGDTQPADRRLPEIPYSDTDYVVPAETAQPDSSMRVPVDANDQSLDIEGYAQLDNCKRVPIDANYQSLDTEGYAQLDSSKRVPTDANYQSLNTEGYAQLDSSMRVPIDANYQSLQTTDQMQIDRDLNENVHQYASSNMDNNPRNEVPEESVYEELP